MKRLSQETINIMGCDVELCDNLVESHAINVTPKFAQILLNNNEKNRKMSPLYVQKYCELLKQNDMQLTHQAIAVSDKGNLLDGQHRLAAVVETGISYKSLIITNLSENVIHAIDHVKTRKISDTFKIEGIRTFTSEKAAISKWLYVYIVKNKSKIRTRNIYNPKAILDFYFQNEDEIKSCLREIINYQNSSKRDSVHKIPFSISEGAFCYYVFKKIDPIRVKEFFTNLCLHDKSNKLTIFKAARDFMYAMKNKTVFTMKRSYHNITTIFMCWNDFIKSVEHRDSYFFDTTTEFQLPDISYEKFK